MTVHTIPVGDLGTNCYVVTDGCGAAAVIDPGADADTIRTVLQKERVQRVGILLTHAHFDHIGAVNALTDLGSSVYCHALDCPALQDGRLNLSAFFGVPTAPIHNAVAVEEGGEIAVGELTFTVLHTPGHTVGSVCYSLGDVLFAGDTLFCESIGRTDFPGGDVRAMRASLERLATLDGNVRVYPGHGEPTAIAHERRHNPYLTR